MSDLAAELADLDESATPSPWHLEKSATRGLFDAHDEAGPLVERCTHPDAELLVWLRNRTDEIKTALAENAEDRGVIRALRRQRDEAEAEAERDRQADILDRVRTYLDQLHADRTTLPDVLRAVADLTAILDEEE